MAVKTTGRREKSPTSLNKIENIANPIYSLYSPVLYEAGIWASYCFNCFILQFSFNMILSAYFTVTYRFVVIKSHIIYFCNL